ncbi:MAG: VCBS repeat-containing protein [Planctomycetaceae bacterium]|nr:VCBS repeat-containing protein [Planctomycetaceae bacterium]
MPRSLLFVSFVSFCAVGSMLCAGEPDFRFRDAGAEAGIFPALENIAGHGAGWGDIDGDGWADLYVGTFGSKPYDSKPNQLLRNQGGKFTLDNQEALRVVGRANGAAIVDLDNDGDLDLYTTNHAIAGKGENAHYQTPNKLFRNDGGGKFTDVSEGSGVCPELIACRSVCATDYDGDGRLDLFVGECFFQGGQSRTRLYRNLGSLKFADVSQQAGLPSELTGFGVAAADVNDDGRPDLLAGGRHHGNKLLVSTADGKYREVPTSLADFTWTYGRDGDDTSCGVCFGDVNRDGRLDIVIGSHFSSPWQAEKGGVPLRLYLHQGVKDGLPAFKDVTQQAGLVPLPMKSPHVEIQDFDNDGWPEIYTSIVKFDSVGRPHPFIFKHLGLADGLPRFRCEALAVNDFPTPADLPLPGNGPFFDKMKAEKKIVYMAPGPTCDYNRDGRLDMFLPNWWPDAKSLLLANETPGGHRLQIAVQAPTGVNPQGIGAQVRVYSAGSLGDNAALVAAQEIAVGYGYASGQEAITHVGGWASWPCAMWR